MTLAGGAVGLGSALGKDVRRDVTNHYDRSLMTFRISYFLCTKQKK